MGYPYVGNNAPYYAPQQQPMFPQPNGNVYIIQNSLEVANIPAGAGITLALCLGENLLYIKSMQNGVPSFLAYKIAPYNEGPQTQTQTTNNETSDLEARVNALEQKLKTLLGGNNNNDAVQPISNASARKSAPTEWET